MKSLEFNFRRLASKSSKQSNRNLHLFLEILISFRESTSRKNTPLNVSLSLIAWRRAGLSCNRSPFLNQWMEFTAIVVILSANVWSWGQTFAKKCYPSTHNFNPFEPNLPQMHPKIHEWNIPIQSWTSTLTIKRKCSIGFKRDGRETE